MKCTFNCLSCNKEYTRYVYELKNNRASFCSLLCKSKYLNKKFTCLNCNKEVVTYLSDFKKNKKYCSRVCAKIHRNVTITCQLCNKQFDGVLSDSLRGGNKYCSQSCAGKVNYKKKAWAKWLSSQERLFKGISTTNHENGCWIWTGAINKAGYGRIRINYSDHTVHRYSYELHYGAIPEGKMICHHCDNPPCCNPDHLYAGTHSDNAKDMYDRNRGRNQKGSKHNMAVLNEEQVLIIRERLQNGEKGINLSKEYNVDTMTISNIKNRKSWKHI